MMKLLKKSLIAIFILTFAACSANAESLFTLGAAQTYRAVPKSLYGGVQARSVGDLISIVISETTSVSNAITYASSKEATTVDRFTPFWNNVVFGKLFGKSLDSSISNYGGSNSVSNSGSSTNKMTFGDTIAVQVIQQMSNGNLIVQGKKTLVNANERVDMVVSGIVDPRWITSTGQVSSSNVANLQFAVTGRGSVSRSNNEGIVNKVIRYLF